ncbi:MAG TPA: tetratricopeptide repeat protein, partial [Polyangiaceae bacterium]|nr:tetratricopeptide repeat protein [Polyangiaceae bacterium]
DPVVARERFRRLAGDLVGERTAEAIRVLEVATALYPESPDAHEWLADACAENGDLTRAHGEYATALRAMSRDPKASADEKTIFRARVTKEMQRAAGIP